jgi:hypothetical protein
VNEWDTPKPAVGKGFWRGLVFGCGLLAIALVVLIVVLVIASEVVYVLL